MSNDGTSRTTAMDRVPYDVWHLIFELVCTDGGYSGCSLALTSRSFRELSTPTRFYSLELSSVREVKNFLICYERIRRTNTLFAQGGPTTPANAAPPAAMPPISNLLLSFLPVTSHDVPPRSALRKWTDYARTEHSLVSQITHGHRLWERSKSLWNRACVLHLSHLLHLAAPTLRTLTALQCGAIRLPLLLPARRLPALRELTLLADDRLFLPGAHVPGENDLSDFAFYGAVGPAPHDGGEPPFPALTHLHVVCAGPKLHPWERSLPLWGALAPALTHLRVSQGNARLPRVLADILGMSPLQSTAAEDQEGADGDGRKDDDEAVADDGCGGAADVDRSRSRDSRLHEVGETGGTFPDLRTVVVQLSGARKNGAGAADPAVREMEGIAEVVCARGGARVAVLRSRAYQPDYWETRLVWEWRERLAGGSGGGCWGEDEADEDAWKMFVDDAGAREDARSHGKRGRGGGHTPKQVVGVSELPEMVGSAATVTANRSRWTRVLAKIPRPRRNNSVVF